MSLQASSFILLKHTSFPRLLYFSNQSNSLFSCLDYVQTHDKIIFVRNMIPRSHYKYYYHHHHFHYNRNKFPLHITFTMCYNFVMFNADSADCANSGELKELFFSLFDAVCMNCVF